MPPLLDAATAASLDFWSQFGAMGTLAGVCLFAVIKLHRERSDLLASFTKQIMEERSACAVERAALQKQIAELQDARVRDQQAAQGMLLGAVEKTGGYIRELSEAAEKISSQPYRR